MWDLMSYVALTPVKPLGLIIGPFHHQPLPTSFVSFGEWICAFLSRWNWGGGVGEGKGRESRNKGSGWWIRVKEVRRVDGNRSCRACWGWRLFNEYRMDSMESKVLSAQDRTMEVYNPSSSYPSTCSSPTRDVYLNRKTCSNRFAYHTNVPHADPCSQEIEKETFKPATPSSPVLTRR